MGGIGSGFCGIPHTLDTGPNQSGTEEGGPKSNRSGETGEKNTTDAPCNINRRNVNLFTGFDNLNDASDQHEEDHEITNGSEEGDGGDNCQNGGECCDEFHGGELIGFP